MPIIICRILLPEIFAGQSADRAVRQQSHFPDVAETAYQTAVRQGCTAGRTSRYAGCSRHRRKRFPCDKVCSRGRRTGGRICGPELENHSDRGGVRSAGFALDNGPAIIFISNSFIGNYSRCLLCKLFCNHIVLYTKC